MDQNNKALNCKTIGLTNVDCTEPKSKSVSDSASFTKLIIFGVPVDITTKKLVRASSAVIAVRIVKSQRGSRCLVINVSQQLNNVHYN